MKAVNQIIILMVVVIPLLAMEQPLRIAHLENYTLVSNDGKEIVLDGNMVREYLPGLAERFREGMIEARGKIVIQDLDGKALANLQSMLTQYGGLKSDFDKKRQELAQKASVEDYPDQMYQLDQYFKEQMALKIAKLPLIGDHFIPLFKELIGWEAPLILEEGMAGFAADNLEIPEAHSLLKEIDPRGQLLYLNAADFSADSVVQILEWLAELETNPITQLFENASLLEKVRVKIVDFIAKNIANVFAKQPAIANVLKKPEFAKLRELLHQELLKANPELFTTIIRPAQPMRTGVPHVSSLGNYWVAFFDRQPQNNVYNVQSKTFKSISQISDYVPGYFVWGNRFVMQVHTQDVPRKSYLYMYDINTGQRIFYDDLQLGEIYDTVPITENQILVIATSGLYTFTYADRKLINKTQLLFPPDTAPLVSYKAISLNEKEFIITFRDYARAVQRFYLFNVSQNRPLKQAFIPVPTVGQVTLRIINNNELGLAFHAPAISQDVTYVRLSLPDFKITSSHFTLGAGLLFLSLLNSEYILVSSRETGISLYNRILGKEIKLPGKLTSAVVIDKNHIAAFDKQSNNFVTVFIPQTSTLDEIFDEIQRKVAAPQVQPQKRAASPRREERPIPAAAQGMRQQEQGKRPRLEKPNG